MRKLRHGPISEFMRRNSLLRKCKEQGNVERVFKKKVFSSSFNDKVEGTVNEAGDYDHVLSVKTSGPFPFHLSSPAEINLQPNI